MVHLKIFLHNYMNKNLKCIKLYYKFDTYYININKKTIKYIFMYEFYDKFLL